MHHTKEKGDLGVLKTQLDLFEKGYIICVPLTEHAPFDLVVVKNNKVYKVQVKYRSLYKGKLTTVLHNSWADKKGNHLKYYEENSFDILAIYCPEHDKVYYLGFEDFKNKTQVTINIYKYKEAL